ncbi:sugar phosphate isomerase/epimerase [Tessaracoccus terricola]
MSRIGLQVMTVREEFAKLGTYETLKKIAGVGFRDLEISQVPMTPENVAEMKRAKEDFGLEISSISAPLDAPEGADSLSGTMDKIIADSRALGAEFVRIGMMDLQSLRAKDSVVAYARRANEAAKQLASEGITLCYHNHHVEFARQDGQLVLDLIRENAPDLRFELDLHWVHRGGMQPVEFLKAYEGVVDLVHLKDYRIGALGDDAYEAMGKGDIAAFMLHFGNVVEFAEVGEGNLDFPSMITVAEAVGAKHLYVEQDSTYGRAPFESLQLSYDNLVAMGYQDKF